MTSPQILTLNVDSQIVERLKKKDYSIYEGSLGNLTNLPYLHQRGSIKCLLNNEIPANLHEFDVVIIDLTNGKTIDYNIQEHTRAHNKSSEETYIICHYPQNLFDPRLFSLSSIKNDLLKSLNKDFLLIVFCSQTESISYELWPSTNIYKVETYNFYPNVAVVGNKFGKQTVVTPKIKDGEIKSLLNKYNNQFTYEAIFRHPQIYKELTYQNDPSFYPLIINKEDEVVSFLKLEGIGAGVLYLPNLIEKENFLIELLDEVAPTLFPNVFPENTKNSWLNDTRYFLPKQSLLINEREEIDKEYNLKLTNKNNEIVENNKQYAFLHDMLTKSGDELVEAVIKFLYWMGFENVKNCDLVFTEELKEEDIQIETQKGLLVIEVKGIGGTSKDRECSQVSKIKHRRCRERGEFDVFACYIVNHQRHKAPVSRSNPPFTDHQISDAKSDERGLITTWQLFNLYFYIENAILTKQQVRESFYDYGYIDFIPKSYKAMAYLRNI